MKQKISKINILIKKKYKYELLENGFSSKDISVGKKVLNSKRITMAQYTKNFENTFAKKLGVKYALMVNSGSSANLLAAFASGNPLRKKHYKAGDEVIVPSISWATTYYPLQQYGLKLNFLDVELDTLNMDVSRLEEALTSKTLMVVAVSILGNPCALTVLRDFCAMGFQIQTQQVN